jgi:uncharacterized membrane protein YdcZ (DUF606 family)
MKTRIAFTRLGQRLDQLADSEAPAWLSAAGLMGSLAFVGLGAGTPRLLALGQVFAIVFGILLAAFTLKAAITAHLRGLAIRTAQIEAELNAQGVLFGLLTRQLQIAHGGQPRRQPPAQPDVYELHDPNDGALRQPAPGTPRRGG